MASLANSVRSSYPEPVGPWGGNGGSQWVYQPNRPIKKIIITSGDILKSIMFESDNGEQSKKYGKTTGSRTYEVELNTPEEYLTAIGGTFQSYSNIPNCIYSLTFTTNVTQYGPYGSTGRNSFSTAIENGAIVGFHGRSGDLVDAIGAFVFYPPEKSSLVMRSAGPWGGCSEKDWDDGVNSVVNQIIVYVDSSLDVIRAVEFKYLKGTIDWSAVHGKLGDDGYVSHEINIDSSENFLIGVSGYYGPVNENAGLEAIRSITFYTDKGTFGPYGKEVGKYFSSSPSKGKVLGFHGRSGHFLTAIGVHKEYMDYL